ncbi:MAG: hypothetical protein Q9160_003682 [Pyrenula sp. 1 TL-2023]
MRSLLTRSVFRALIANYPYPVRGCEKSHRGKQYGNTNRCSRVQAAQFSAISFSNILGFGPKKKIKTNTAEPGFEEMTNLMEAKTKQYQLPEKAQILEAFRSFFNSHCARPRNVTANQLAVATEALRFLQEGSESGLAVEIDEKAGLTSTDYLKALQAIADIPARERVDIAAEPFTTLLFQAILEYAGEASSTTKISKTIYTPSLRMYVEILARIGFSKRAKDILRTVHNDHIILADELWQHVLKGLLTEGHEDEALETLKNLTHMGRAQKAALFEFVNQGLAARSLLEPIKKLYALAESESLLLNVMTHKAIVTLCLRLGDFTFGDRIVDEYKKQGSSQEVRYLSAIWSARQGDAQQVLSRIHEHNTEGEFTTEQEKDIVNALIQYYADIQDPSSLDKCLTFWETNNLGHSSTFLLCRVQFWLDTGNVVQAYRGYHMLQSEEIDPESDEKANWLLSRLLTATCLSKEAPYEQIVELLDASVKQKVIFEPQTVAAVCFRLLLQKELSETAEFLAPRISSYPTSERALVQEEFLRICTDETTDDIHAWDVYELFRHVFSESSVEIRSGIMRSFFARGRGDLACLVFGHMRQSEITERRPTADTYAECFAGIAKEGNKEGLNLVHNMLKLDIEVTPTVKVINGLMAAYAGCGMSWRSLEFFEDLLNSKDGPNQSSFAIAFRACETYFGDGASQAYLIMENLKKTDVDLTRDMYVAYIGAMAANNRPSHGCELISQMESAVGQKPDAFVIGSLYNSIPWDFQKDGAQDWAMKTYPELWEELSCIPRKEDAWGNQNFDIDRSITP